MLAVALAGPVFGIEPLGPTDFGFRPSSSSYQILVLGQDLFAFTGVLSLPASKMVNPTKPVPNRLGDNTSDTWEGEGVSIFYMRPGKPMDYA